MAEAKKSTKSKKSDEAQISQDHKKLSKYEIARLIGARALQLSQGAPLKVELSKKELQDINYDVMAIAKIEFEKGLLPLKIESE